MVQIIIIKVVAGISIILMLAAVLAYLKATQELNWYKKQYYSQPRVNKVPRPSKFQLWMNTILCLPTFHPKQVSE